MKQVIPAVLTRLAPARKTVLLEKTGSSGVFVFRAVKTPVVVGKWTTSGDMPDGSEHLRPPVAEGCNGWVARMVEKARGDEDTSSQWLHFALPVVSEVHL